MAKILIVDDEPRFLRLLEANLTLGVGHEVIKASNGVEAVRLAAEEHPDLILTDIMMPQMSGWEMCAYIKATPGLAHIPVIFLSAKGELRDVLRGYAVGGIDYLVKPFSAEELIRRVNVVTDMVQLGLFGKKIRVWSNQDRLKRVIDFCKEEIERRDSLMIRLSEDIQELEKRLGEVYRELKQLKSAASQNQESSERELTQKNDHLYKPNSDSYYPLRELSQVTDGIIHDMRNGLGIIRNTVGFLDEDLAGTPNAKDVLKIARSVDFCEVVLRNLSVLGGQEVLRFEKVNLETIVCEICFMLESKLVDVNLVVDTDGQDPIIQADAGHIKQIFMNLIKNAGEAMPNGGTLTCRFRLEKDMMLIEVQDTGRGITEENLQRLFREFFTTKERGYGIGLTVVDAIVKRQGGTISVKSKPGEGTTFTLLLPVEGKQ
jgi:signal transduction histidine kinase